MRERKQVVGRPFLYGTTRDFLMHFGLGSLADLPPLEEFEEALGIESSTPEPVEAESSPDPVEVESA